MGNLLRLALCLAALPSLRAQSPSDNDLFNQFRTPGADAEKALATVLQAPETHSAAVLYFAAGYAWKYHRLEDAGFLFYAARVRAVFDRKVYPVQGGDLSAFGALAATLGQNITPALLNDTPTFKKVLQRVKIWEPALPAGYDPGWRYTAKGDEKAAAAATRDYRDAFFGNLESTCNLLLNDEYRAANQIATDYNDFTRKAGHARPAREDFEAAERTLERIEREQNLRDLAARRTGGGTAGAAPAPGLPSPAGQFAKEEDAALASAAMAGDADEVARLVKSGANPDAISKDGLPLLGWAMLAHNLVGYEALLDQHASPEAAIKHRGLAPSILQQAINTHPEESFWFEQLLKHGANPNFVVDPDIGNTLLFAAIEARRTDLTAILISHGADLNRSNSIGSTPLLQAVSWGTSLSSALELLQAGADWKSVNQRGKGCIDSLSDLANRAAKNPSNQGQSWQDYVAVVKWLAAHGAAIPDNITALVPDPGSSAIRQ